MTWVQWLRAGNGSPEHLLHFESVAIPQITRALLRRRYAETNMTATVRVRRARAHALSPSSSFSRASL